MVSWELPSCCVHQKWTQWHLEYPRPRWHITLMYSTFTVPTISRPRLYSSFLQLPSLALRGENMHSLTSKVCQYFSLISVVYWKLDFILQLNADIQLLSGEFWVVFLTSPLKKLHFLGRNYQLITHIQINHIKSMSIF